MTTKKWLKRNTHSLIGKTVAISGSTGGIGQHLCRYLANLGANLVLLDRNRTKSEALKNRLQEEFSQVSVELLTADMEDLASVKQAADALTAMKPYALILNAGAYAIQRHKCGTGLDNVFQINFFSPYFLARKMQEIGTKVVAVGSIAHNYSKTDMADFDFSTRKKASLCYGNAKRFLMFSLYGLFEGGKGLAVTHPGITFTNITAHYPPWLFAIIKHPMKVIFMHPKRACLSILRGLFEDCGKNQWIGPRIFDIWGLPKKRTLRTCHAAEGERICQKAEELYEKIAATNSCGG